MKDWENCVCVTVSVSPEFLGQYLKVATAGELSLDDWKCPFAWCRKCQREYLSLWYWSWCCNIFVGFKNVFTYFSWEELSTHQSVFMGWSWKNLRCRNLTPAWVWVWLCGAFLLRKEWINFPLILQARWEVMSSCVSSTLVMKWMKLVGVKLILFGCDRPCELTGVISNYLMWIQSKCLNHNCPIHLQFL